MTESEGHARAVPDRRRFGARGGLLALLIVAGLAVTGCGESHPHPLVEARESREKEERVTNTFCLESGSRNGALSKGGKNAEELYEVACE